MISSSQQLLEYAAHAGLGSWALPGVFAKPRLAVHGHSGDYRDSAEGLALVLLREVPKHTVVIPTETFKREKVILARKRTSFFYSLALCCTESTASRGILFLMAMLGCWTEQHHSHGISYAAATKGNCLGKVHSGTRQHSRAGSAAGVWNCSQRELQASQNQPFPKSSPSPQQEIES